MEVNLGRGHSRLAFNIQLQKEDRSTLPPVFEGGRPLDQADFQPAIFKQRIQELDMLKAL
jgi:hypothetical protein